MGLHERLEGLRRATQIQGAFSLQGRHEHPFMRRQNFGRFTHEAHAGYHQRRTVAITSKAGHFQGVGDVSAGFFRQVLNIRIHVIVRHQPGVQLGELPCDGRFQGLTLRRIEPAGFEHRHLFCA